MARDTRRLGIEPEDQTRRRRSSRTRRCATPAPCETSSCINGAHAIAHLITMQAVRRRGQSTMYGVVAAGKQGLPKGVIGWDLELVLVFFFSFLSLWPSGMCPGLLLAGCLLWPRLMALAGGLPASLAMRMNAMECRILGP